ncbi:MAG: redoxin domain-containing protein [Deltaproteobacteria bacterium]|nr:redoxin domain-containing protein [Deltaproteobacteria bacterium]
MMGAMTRRLWLVATLCMLACRLRADAEQPREVAPEFTLPDADGNPVSLAQLRSRGPVVLVFYRGWW